jgi:hydrogenase nickel incorporation protein HypB
MHEVADEHMLENILANNEELASHNREHLDELNAWTVNIMSAPGAGKTRLLEATLLALKDEYCFCVIEGDMVGELDKERLSKTGVPVVQISTGRSCHLNAQMIARVLHNKEIEKPDILFIENVGNLVCPAEFLLGEHKRVVLLSVAEGDDKPIKYPVIFRNCDAIILTKADLLPYVDFQIARAKFNIEALNINAKIFTVSSLTGEGIAEWCVWLKDQVSNYHQQLNKDGLYGNSGLTRTNHHVKSLNSSEPSHKVSTI